MEDLIGAPHNVIRHPDVPRCVFKLLWDTIEAKREVLAYVVNLASDGDHYWVFAHVTPTLSSVQHRGILLERAQAGPHEVARSHRR
nr:hypothetical protein [Bradyrhizobium zhanjiangense]